MSHAWDTWAANEIKDLQRRINYLFTKYRARVRRAAPVFTFDPNTPDRPRHQPDGAERGAQAATARPIAPCSRRAASQDSAAIRAAVPRQSGSPPSW